MNHDDRTVARTGLVAGLLGASAGIAEVSAGTVSWAGNKNDPTTLGLVTIALGVVIAAASMLAVRSRRPGGHLGAASTLLACGLIGLTTAGLAWLPAGIAAVAAFILVLRRPRASRAWRTALIANWAPTLVAVLALIYLAFGIVARSGVGLVGIAGAALACGALAVHRQRAIAGAALVLGAVPFAVATGWTLVIPFTAVLMVSIGLPYILTSSTSTSPQGGTS